MNKKTAVIFPLLILSFLIILTGCGSNVADKKDQDNGQKNAYNSTAPADSNNSVKDDGESEKKAEPEDSKKYLRAPAPWPRPCPTMRPGGAPP